MHLIKVLMGKKTEIKKKKEKKKKKKKTDFESRLNLP